MDVRNSIFFGNSSLARNLITACLIAASALVTLIGLANASAPFAAYLPLIGVILGYISAALAMYSAIRNAVAERNKSKLINAELLGLRKDIDELKMAYLAGGSEKVAAE